MHILPLEEYSLRCIIQLARTWSDQIQLSASNISQMEGLSPEYVGKIMHLLKKAKVVRGLRGTDGGFLLLKSPSEIRLIEIFNAVKNKNADENFCSQFKGQGSECVHIHECSVRPVWVLLSSYFDQVLSDITIQDLLNYERAVYERIESIAVEKAKDLRASFLKR